MLIEVPTANGYFSINPQHIVSLKRMTIAEGIVRLTVGLVNNSSVTEDLPAAQVNTIHHHFAAFAEAETAVRTTMGTVYSVKTGTDSGGGTTYNYELKQADVPCVMAADSVSFFSADLTNPLTFGDRLVTADGTSYFVGGICEIPIRSGLPTRIRAELSSEDSQRSPTLAIRRAG